MLPSWKKRFQGWEAGSSERNGFLQDRFLIKHRAGPTFFFSLMVPPNYLGSVVKEADLSLGRVLSGKRGNCRQIKKIRESTTTVLIGSEQSCSPYYSHVLQRHLLQVKRSYWLCVWLRHSDASGKQVSAEYQGMLQNATLPRRTSKLQPWMLAVASGLRMQRLCCFPSIQKNCHSLHSIDPH